MSFDFKKAAQETTLLSPVMLNRDKLETPDVINQDLTIIEFGFAPKFDDKGRPVVDASTGEVDTFGVVVFAEKPHHYYCVGTVFTKVCHAWAAEFPTAEEASTALRESGGVRVRFTGSKTKKGNNLTAVEILN